MTTELEEQFFKVFGIKPIRYIVDIGQWDCGTNSKKSLITDISIDYYDKHFKNNNLTPLKGVVYPKITNDILLQMICINSQKGGIEIFNRKNIEELKNSMLQHCIDRLGYALNKEQYKAKIQQLFKEE